jgi:glycosyltransferase involved in cell wall biosynthesis
MTERVIALDYTAAVHQSAGIGRYVRELTAALAQRAAPEFRPLRLFVAGARGLDLPPTPSGCVYCPSFLSERTHARLWQRLQLPLPVELWTGRVALFHATDFSLPPTLPKTPTVLNIHDLAFERYPAETMPGMLGYLRRVVPRSARQASHLIAISEATRRDLIELYGLPAEKISVVYPGVSARFSAPAPQSEAEVRAKYGLPDAPIVLTVGTLQPRKNHLRLVRAFSRVRDRAVLVIAGGEGWAYDAVRNEIARLHLSERVIFTGFVDDADLPALYRVATLFAYPALYEGFGLPVLEAMACGLPVVTSEVSSLPEVTGAEAALLINPLDEEALAMALDRLLDDETLRAALAEKGRLRAGQFTWARTAEAIWGVYRALLHLA